jgi:hypothetical protein
MTKTLANLKAEIIHLEEKVRHLTRLAAEMKELERAEIIRDARMKISVYGLTAGDLMLEEGKTRKKKVRDVGNGDTDRDMQYRSYACQRAVFISPRT